MRDSSNKFDLFFSWYFQGMPSSVVQIYKKTYQYIWHWFSVGYLIKTLFEPFKRDISLPVNPSIQNRFQAFISNIISRIMGLIIRLLTVISAFLIEFLLMLILGIVIIIWYLLFVIIILVIIKDISLLLV